MKKILNVFAIAAAAVVITSCNPLDKTYKTIDDNPIPAGASSYTYTVAAADFKLLPSTSSAYVNGVFSTSVDANTYVPTILAAKYPLAGNGSKATVTYNIATATPQIKLTDSLFKDVAYTLTASDYLLLPNNKYADFSDAQVESWLPYAGNPTNAVGTSFGSPVGNTLALLTFNYYATGTTTVQTFSYLYINSAWKKIYTITPAQYASIGKGGTNNDFSSGDAPNLAAYFNTFLKADPSVMATAKVGDFQYVSYKYYVSAANTFQRVMTLQFDGTNWTTGAVTTTVTSTFSKTNGSWASQKIISYTLNSADIELIANSTAGTSDARTNLESYKDFDSAWGVADLDAAMIVVLTADYTAPETGAIYSVTYPKYSGSAPNPLNFLWDGSKWVAQQ